MTQGSRLWKTLRPIAYKLPDRWRVRAFHASEYLRCTTPRKLVNWAAIKIGHWLRLDRPAGMPTHYFIDPINICNLHCPLCPTGRGVLARPRGRMALSDFLGIIDQIAAHAYRIELYNWGEPLLHPEIIDMIEYAHRNRISTGLSTNLNRLSTGMAERLIRSGLSQLLISIDGATQETYAAYRLGGNLDRVLDNLTTLVETRRTLESATPFITARMLVGKHNERDVKATRRLVTDIGVDGFTTGLLYVDTTDPVQVEQWLPTDPAYSPYRHIHSRDKVAGGLANKPALQNEWACDDLWESMVINWDGGVALLWLHDPQYDFGNASQESIRQIWNGPHYASARRAIGWRAIGRRGARHRKPGTDDVSTICHRCRGHPHYMAY